MIAQPGYAPTQAFQILTYAEQQANFRLKQARVGKARARRFEQAERGPGVPLPEQEFGLT